MNRYAAIAMRVAGDLEDAIATMSDLKDLYTDYGAMKVESAKKESAQGDRVTIECVLYFDKLVYSASYIGHRLISKVGEAVALQAFQQVLDDLRGGILRKITTKLEEDPPMNRVVGWDKADDYDDIKGKVQSFSFGKTFVKFGEVGIEGRVKMVIQAHKLPELATGIYNQMSDAQMKRLVQEYANYAPENFWMDGEYRGSAAARIRQIMQQWRAMTPNQQQKHFNESKQWR